jgi:hypothetical protein
MPKGNPDAESEPSIRWDACQEYEGSWDIGHREIGVPKDKKVETSKVSKSRELI